MPDQQSSPSHCYAATNSLIRSSSACTPPPAGSLRHTRVRPIAQSHGKGITHPARQPGLCVGAWPSPNHKAASFPALWSCPTQTSRSSRPEQPRE